MNTVINNEAVNRLQEISAELAKPFSADAASIWRLRDIAKEIMSLANSLSRCERVCFTDVWPKELSKEDAEHHRLPLYLGITSEGKTHVMDLAKTAHLLIGGEDVSGMSNLMRSIVCGLTQLLSPEQVRFVVLDSSCADFASYMKLPHLALPIIAEDGEYGSVLNSLVGEMERRLKLFAKAGCHNIDGFNSRKENSNGEAVEDLFGIGIDNELPDSLPYIVVVMNEIRRLPIIDHFLISRLTSKGCSAGIHLIVSTQFIDALTLPASLRACFRTHIVFKTNSGEESKLLINSPYAEMLNGTGDMIVRQQDDAFLVRTQSTDISSTEEMAIIAEAQKMYTPMKPLFEINSDPFAHKFNTPQIDDEELYKKALEVIRATKRASIPLFQRRMGIGYNHASRLMDLLEERGVVGEAGGAGNGFQREIKIDLEKDNEMGR